MDYLLNNIQLLKRHHNITIDRELDKDKYVIETSKDNKLILKVENNGKAVYLGSKYNNTQQINAFMKDFNLSDGESMYVVIGFGTGEHIEALLDNCGSNNKIIVLEPDSNIISASINKKDFRKLFSDNRVKIYNYEKDNDVIEILEKEIDRSYVNVINVNYFANYDKLYGEKVINAYKAVQMFYNVMIATANTNKVFSQRVIENYFNNLLYIIKGKNALDYKGIFRGKTAVIVSSGPSLEKNVHLLKGNEDKLLIIAAGRSLKELLDNGIRPHFVCALDPGDIISSLMSSVSTSNIPLVSVEQVNYKLLKEYQGEKIFVINSLTKLLGEMFQKEYVQLPVGGSVAHLGTSFAAYLGVKSIIFIGQDLAYTNNKYHSSASSNESLINSDAIISSENTLWVEGNTEEKVLSSKSFEIFRLWFELFIRSNSNIKYTNCTEGGAKIKGTEIKTLKEAIEQIDDESIDFATGINKASAEKEGVEIKIALKSISILSNKLTAMRSSALEGVTLSEKMRDHYQGKFNSKISGILRKLELIDKSYKKELEISSLINLCVYEEMWDISSNPLLREKVKESDDEKGIRLATRGIAIYNSIIKAIDRIMPILGVTLENLNKE